MADEDDGDRKLNYSIKVTVGGGFAILFVGAFGYFFSDKIDMRWVFLPVWVVAMLAILYGVFWNWFNKD